MKNVAKLARALSLTLLPVAVVLLAAPPSAAQQPRPLDHEDVLHWNTIASPSLSPDGRWLAFTMTAMEGDPQVTVAVAESDGARLTAHGTNPVFTSGSGYVVYNVPPLEAVVDSLKGEGKTGDDLPKNSLAVVDLSVVFAGGAPSMEQVRIIGPIEGYKVAGQGSWIAYVPVVDEDEADESEEEDANPPEAEEGEPGEEAEEDPDEDDKKKESGSPLVLLNLATGEEMDFADVTDYDFAEEGGLFSFATSTEDGTGDGVHVVALEDGTVHLVMEGEGNYKQLQVGKDGSQIAFLADRDDYAADQPEFSLYRAGAPVWDATLIANSASPGVPPGWWVSENGALSFSKEGRLVQFGTAPRPAPEEDDDTLDEDKVTLDVWNWKDPYLQPMQLVQLENEQRRTYAAVAPADNGGQVVQLGSEEVPTVRFPETEELSFVLGLTDMPYRQLISWDGRYNDIYAISATTGERRQLAAKVKGFGGASLSPGGKYAYWWDGDLRQWMVVGMDGGEAVAASAKVPHAVWNELDDHPDLPPPYGSSGWTEDDDSFLFYDRYDVWAFSPSSAELTNLTDGAGREAGLRYRYARTEPELDYIPSGEVLWQAFHYKNKQSGFFRGRSDREDRPEQVIMANKSYRLRAKADDADRWLITREDFREFPDLWLAGEALADMERVSDANPQQADFRWGSAEVVEWNSNDGVPLQGMLFTPDDFDPSDTYPMMVYFYERMSDGLHNYRSPRPGGSSISVPFYVSRGYVVFIPDIPYEIGYPGESALDAVVPGVLHVLAKGFVDKDKIGVQGHSWGGYQIAYMITKTNLFAAAEAGAPVSNMTSAYGGIRWQSGMSRMFQYERTQSRIGGSLWESTSEYLHNSPVFYADKIWTPLLMMHNDEDGAVPWYQGIEMFVAMRRLQRPVWMLNYNGEAHGLRREANRKDWAIRMQQFFDHYLMDAPAPVWMEEGIPATEKGKTLGTELTTRKVS